MQRKGKKHKRRKKNQKKRHRRCNRHHLLWPRKQWDESHAKTLRQHPYCQKFLDERDVHERVHAQIYGIPVPSNSECKRAVKAIDKLVVNKHISVGDSAEKKLSILIGIWQKNKANDATVAALELQRFYIKKYTKKGRS